MVISANPNSSAHRHLVVMLKEPRPGRVKTRLGKDIGMTTAAWWFRHQTASLLRRLRDPRWELVIAVAPDREGLQSRIWPPDIARSPQGQGDLGTRMISQINRFAGPVCVIGGDIPGIQRHHIKTCFDHLGRHDWVFGPSDDGGYWLVGAKGWPKVARSQFAGVRWSTEHALADSVACLGDQRIAFGPELSDVDCVADLEK